MISVNAPKLSEVADIFGAALHGEDAVFSGVSTDTRTLQSGNLFVALQGPNFDGEQFLAVAQEKGAVGALVSQIVPEISLPQIAVQPACENTRIALGKLASMWRQQFDIPIVAITGSNGKTTVKEMVASILRVGKSGQLNGESAEEISGLQTQGNFNNDIGMPLTLLRLSLEHRWAVIEMGANAPGEIAYLSKLAKPTVALVNNVGAAHLSGFGSIAQIVEEKGAIYSGLGKDGVAVVNADSPHVNRWQEIVEKNAGKKIVTFSANDKNLNALIPEKFPLLGEHNQMNACAAIVVALQMGANSEQIRRGLEKMQPVAGRLQRKAGLYSSQVIDDTYNANPDSLKSAMEVLAGFAGKTILVLGDMGELGNEGAELHRQAGVQAKKLGIDQFYTLGELAREAQAGFDEDYKNLPSSSFIKGGNLHGEEEFHFQDHDSLVNALKKDLGKNVTVLVKGSRFMHMEQVVEQITEQNQKNTKEQSS